MDMDVVARAGHQCGYIEALARRGESLPGYTVEDAQAGYADAVETANALVARLRVVARAVGAYFDGATIYDHTGRVSPLRAAFDALEPGDLDDV